MNFATVAEWSDEKKHANVAKEIYFCVYEMKFQAADASEKRCMRIFKVQQPEPYQLRPDSVDDSKLLPSEIQIQITPQPPSLKKQRELSPRCCGKINLEQRTNVLNSKQVP